MTIDGPFERLEHFTAAEAAQRRKDREEDRQLWRDTQRQINELTLKIADTNDSVARLADRVDGLGEKIDRLAQESREADRRLGERIDALVSAIGVFMSKQNPPQS
jgi:septal ring factor EnvC (AmiA/AmiB activator)